MRHGQWVLFSNKVPGAHVATNGKTVGIYHQARLDPFGKPVPPCIYPVSQDTGENLPGRGLLPLRLLLVQYTGQMDDFMGLDVVKDLEPVMNRADIPQDRVGLHQDPEWSPKP